MTLAEFSDGFSTLLNSNSLRARFGDTYARQDIVLDEYEKGVFLTAAQDIVIRAAVDKAYNPNRQGAEDSYARQADFAGLITTTNSTTFNPPYLHILSETYGDNTVTYAVKPLTYEEYERRLSKPYSKPLRKQVWRLQNGDNSVTIISGGKTGSYSARYIQRPSPIVLVSSAAGGGQTPTSAAELTKTAPFHTEILLKAVELAVASRRGIAANQGGQDR